jgi:hypothetical protein
MKTFTGRIPNQTYCAKFKSMNEIPTAIPKIMGIDSRPNKVPLMNNGFMSFSTSRCPFVAYPHINTSREPVIITIAQ